MTGNQKTKVNPEKGNSISGEKRPKSTSGGSEMKYIVISNLGLLLTLLAFFGKSVWGKSVWPPGA
jgi:hypothetical protein